MSSTVKIISQYTESSKMSDMEKIEKTLSRVNINSPIKSRPRRSTVAPKNYAEPLLSPTKRKIVSKWQDDNTSPTKTRRNSTASNTPKRSLNFDKINTPEVRTPNLDDSFRKTVLKVNLTQSLAVMEKPTPRRTSKFFYYESTSDDESDIEETVTEKRKVKKPERLIDSIKKPERLIDSINKTPTRRGRPRKSEIENTTPYTPRKRRSPKKYIESDDEYVEVELLKTPTKTPRARRLTIATTPKSGTKSRAKLIRDGVITPSMHARDKSIAGDSTPLMKARSQLHVSHVPTALPCRENEYSDVKHFLEGKLLDGCGGCMYISGVPGTGKTATVTSVINTLTQNKKLPKFNFVSINGMRLTEPRQSYVEILKQLNNKTVPWEQAQSILEDMFTKTKKKSAPVVMLIDELDILCTKRQDVVYNLLDWPTKAKNQLVVITIANTMDLPERLLMSRVTSRLGLTRLTFQAYTHKQLQEIVTKRLIGTNSFNSDAIQFVARKVASVSGDARRALDICRRAAEIAELENEQGLVTMQHVNEALNAMITQPKVRAIKHCSRLEQLLLQTIVAEVRIHR
ncbi:unnamed protein product [Brassicogethes aeneus]|uniref:Origin recognition complex subunit 1 n=1 Tax=Brassicogethes aeneus TaxID=1431903 RepID=A0A9P0AWT9_BRAAE|nr:unnamed protein product [Brassicogethes aeneus]